MRKLVALVFFVALAAVPASARANEAMLWACHGPDGRTLPISYDASRSVGAFITPTSSVPCASPADTIRLGFDNTSPPEGSFAALRFNPPAGGVTIAGVWLGRRVTGPGYFARTSAGDLETLDGAGTLDGVFTQAATGSWVELGVRCASAGCDMTGAALDFRFDRAEGRATSSAPTFTDQQPPGLRGGHAQADRRRARQRDRAREHRRHARRGAARVRPRSAPAPAASSRPATRPSTCRSTTTARRAGAWR